ncbi:tripartite motif-containing protein 59-like [Symsagittifera roscoffensis]|uniref:tripartite motif-containing protein 59-like n=1 Tax=Symsagittifera roscoffensis TaxID=84072 RepID=UPI00307B716C
MATSSRLSESLQCSICYDMFVDPRVLPCGHSFCGPPKSCLEGVKYNNGEASKCAVCNQIFGVKVSELKPLYGFREALETLRAGKLRDANVDANDDELDCDSASSLCHHALMNIKMWCNDCQVKLCLPCVDRHHSDHALKSYKAVLREQAQQTLSIMQRLNKQTLEIAVEIKQLQVKQKEIDDVIKHQRSVENILSGSKVELTSELIELLESKYVDKMSFVLPKEIDNFEVETKIENIQFPSEGESSKTSMIKEMGGFNFRLQCTVDKKWLGLFLLVTSSEPKKMWKISLKFQFTLVSSNSSKSVATNNFQTQEFSSEKGRRIGFPNFIPSKDVQNPKKGFLAEPATITVKTAIYNFEL